MEQVHESGVQPLHVLIAEAESRQATRPEVLDEDVCAQHERPQRFRSRGFIKVERDAPLTAIHSDKITAPVAHERRPAARVVTVLGFFNLDDFGAHVAQKHRTKWAGKDFREIHDLDSVQRRHRGSSPM